MYKLAREYGGTKCEVIVANPRRFANKLSLGLLQAYIYTFGAFPNNISGHESAVVPSEFPGSHSTVPLKISNVELEINESV